MMTIAPEFTTGFSEVRVVRSLIFCVMFCRSSFVLLYFLVWSLCCMSFDLRILITPLVSWPLCCMSFDLRILITPLVSWSLCRMSFDLRILITPLVSWSLCCMSFDLRILITPLVSSNSSWLFCFYVICVTCSLDQKCFGSPIVSDEG